MTEVSFTETFYVYIDIHTWGQSAVFLDGWNLFSMTAFPIFNMLSYSTASQMSEEVSH